MTRREAWERLDDDAAGPELDRIDALSSLEIAAERAARKRSPSARALRDPRAVWDALEDDAAGPELDRIDALTTDEMAAERAARRRGPGPALVIAPRAPEASPATVPASNVVSLRARRTLTVRFASSLIAAAVCLALAAGTAIGLALRESPPPAPRAPVPEAPAPRQAPPEVMVDTHDEEVATLRQVAADLYVRHRGKECAAILGVATKLDPRPNPDLAKEKADCDRLWNHQLNSKATAPGQEPR